MSLGIKFFIIQMAAVIFYQTSNIIISHLFGPEQVTPYNIAYKYFGVVTMLFGMIMVPLWSAYTEAWIKKDIDWIKNTIKKLILIWGLVTLGVIIMFIASKFIYRMWVGKEIIVPVSVSAVMAIYVIVNGWCGIFSQFLNGVGKIKLQLIIGLLGALINIPLAIFLGKHLGIYGVLLSTVLLSALSAVISPLQYLKIINYRATGVWNK
jgi:O-antigen/teichoic acid export membrane protein